MADYLQLFILNGKGTEHRMFLNALVVLLHKMNGAKSLSETLVAGSVLIRMETHYY